MNSKEGARADFQDSGRTVHLSQVLCMRLQPSGHHSRITRWCVVWRVPRVKASNLKAPWTFFPLFSCRKRPHFVLPAKVTRSLWRAATAHHKSAHLTKGPQIYQPECFESGGHFVTCKGVGGAQSRKRCPVPGPQPDFTAASSKTRRYKGPESTLVSRAKLLGNKSFWGFMKKEKGKGGMLGSVLPWPKEYSKKGVHKIRSSKKGQISIFMVTPSW